MRTEFRTVELHQLKQGRKIILEVRVANARITQVNIRDIANSNLTSTILLEFLRNIGIICELNSVLVPAQSSESHIFGLSDGKYCLSIIDGAAILTPRK